jgi:hypothetical protein
MIEANVPKEKQCANVYMFHQVSRRGHIGSPLVELV